MDSGKSAAQIPATKRQTHKNRATEPPVASARRRRVIAHPNSAAEFDDRGGTKQYSGNLNGYSIYSIREDAGPVKWLQGITLIKLNSARSGFRRRRRMHSSRHNRIEKGFRWVLTNGNNRLASASRREPSWTLSSPIYVGSGISNGSGDSTPCLLHFKFGYCLMESSGRSLSENSDRGEGEAD
jgi:hypothetical protein